MMDEIHAEPLGLEGKGKEAIAYTDARFATILKRLAGTDFDADFYLVSENPKSQLFFYTAIEGVSLTQELLSIEVKDQATGSLLIHAVLSFKNLVLEAHTEFGFLQQLFVGVTI